MPPVSIIMLLFLIIGGLNWGLVGLFNFDLVAAIFGGDPGIKSACPHCLHDRRRSSDLLHNAHSGAF